MTKILIAVDGSERSADALAFGRALALAAGAPVVLATAYAPVAWQQRLDGLPHDDELRAEAEAMLARLSTALHDVADLELRPLADHSAARALLSCAEQTGAGIIVAGSSHTGRLGRVLPGSTAERLLHGAPCPVAVVPLGFRTNRLAENPVIGCAYQPTEDGAAALGTAEELAVALSASLRVIQAYEPPSYPYDTGEMPLDMPDIDARFRADAERALAERVEHLSVGLDDVEGTLHVGKPADVLIDLSETVDAMVVGSRGYGPLKAVLLGGVSGQLIRSAACPVIVVPRGARSAVGSLFAPSTAADGVLRRRRWRR